MFTSQNNETELVLNFFNEYYRDSQKTVLSVGENDGKTLSNSYDLIRAGWYGILLEPSPKAFAKLSELYKDDKMVKCLNYGISDQTGILHFNESGSFNHTGNDVALLSSLVDSEKDRWGDTVSFEAIEAKFLTFADFLKDIFSGVSVFEYRNTAPNQQPQCFDYISIDCEGVDIQVLKQINLNSVGCKCLCIEHNGIFDLLEQYKNYVTPFGFVELSRNPENIIFVKYPNE